MNIYVLNAMQDFHFFRVCIPLKTARNVLNVPPEKLRNQYPHSAVTQIPSPVQLLRNMPQDLAQEAVEVFVHAEQLVQGKEQSFIYGLP